MAPKRERASISSRIIRNQIRRTRASHYPVHSVYLQRYPVHHVLGVNAVSEVPQKTSNLYRNVIRYAGYVVINVSTRHFWRRKMQIAVSRPNGYDTIVPNGAVILVARFVTSGRGMFFIGQ